QSVNCCNPSSVEVSDLKPTASSKRSVEAYVLGTSPGLIGSNSFLNSTSLPNELLKHFSNVVIKCINFSGLLFPILYTLCGTSSFVGGASINFSIPLTISSIYVKSRYKSLSKSPLLKILIGSSLKNLSVKPKYAISGRPIGPYTVKNRNPVAGMLYK